MVHSFKMHFFHLVWSTKGRRAFIIPHIQERLYDYLKGILGSHNGKLLKIGGMPDHIHLLIELSNIDKFSEIIRDLKASSCSWVHKEFFTMKDFAWQEGYSSFSVSYSQLASVEKYIHNQKIHHEGVSFEEEYRNLLAKHHIQFDDRFVFG